jgi:hypothetical protein
MGVGSEFFISKAFEMGQIMDKVTTFLALVKKKISGQIKPGEILIVLPLYVYIPLLF